MRYFPLMDFCVGCTSSDLKGNCLAPHRRCAMKDGHSEEAMKEVKRIIKLFEDVD